MRQSSALQAAYYENGSALDPTAPSEVDRPATVHDLSSEVIATAVMAPPDSQMQSLEEVYQQAGVRTAAHGFSILKIANMLNSVHIRHLGLDAKRAAVMMVLEASNIELKEVMEDATQRERALNDYEARQQQTFQNYKTGKQQQNEEIQAEIKRLTEQLQLKIQANQKELANEKSRLDEWRSKKREEERRIRSAASQFGGIGNASREETDHPKR